MYSHTPPLGWLSRLLTLVLLSMLLILPASAQDTPAFSDSPYYPLLGINLTGVGDRALEFVDAARTLRPWESLTDQPLRVDENGYPLEDARTVFFDLRPAFAWAPPLDDPAAFQIDVSGVYRLSFTGRADLAPVSDDPGANTFTIEHQVYDAATNITTADVILRAGEGLLYMEFRNTDGGVRDVHLIRPGYPADTTQVFTDAFIASLQPFSVLRLMDWLHTNNSNPPFTAADQLTEWAERRLPTDTTQQPDGATYGVAWEYVIMLANQTGKDIWINIPVAASDDYIRQLAAMMHRDLKPEINIYIEHSNEVWNSGFTQYEYNRSAAAAEIEGGNSNLNNDGSANPAAWTVRRHARRTLEAGQIFAEVFGAEALNTRLRPVLSWFVNDLSQYTAALDWLAATYGSPTDYLYGIAGAPYFSDSAVAGTDASIPDILAAMLNSGNSSVDARRELIRMAQANGLQPLLYEAGPDNGGGDPTNVANRILANRDPAMRGLVLHDLVNNWYDLGGGLYMYFAHAGAYSRYGSWGATEAITDLSTPKYQAFYDLLGQPLSPPTAPLSMHAEAASGSLGLRWSPVFGVTGYGLERRTPAESAFTLLAADLTTPAYTDTGLSDGTPYVYRVFSVNALGPGSPSAEFTFTPGTPAVVTYADNLLLNGGFEDELNGWNQFVEAVAAEGTITASADLPLAGEYSALFDIVRAGDQDWHVMLFSPFQLYAGNTYEISFVAAADASEPVRLTVMLESSGEPWTRFWAQDVMLSPEPVSYGVYTFTALETAENVNFMLRLGGNPAARVRLDTVLIRQVGGANPQAPR